MHLQQQTCVNVRVSRDGAVSRRAFLRRLGVGAAGLALFDRLTLHADEVRKQHKVVILLWMAGGPSQFETFDPKPGAQTQGPTRAVRTAAPCVAIAEHWTRTATLTRELAIIRSMTTKEGNHGRATYLLQTGYAPMRLDLRPIWSSRSAPASCMPC